jgi:hypothetical protein
MEKCEPGENVNHGKKKLISVNQNYVNLNYVNQNYVNQKMLVHGKKLEKKFT